MFFELIFSFFKKLYIFAIEIIGLIIIIKMKTILKFSN